MAKKANLAVVQDFERQTPQAQDAEAAVLGAMILDRDAIGTVIDEKIDADCFYFEAHRKVYEAIVALYEKSIDIDAVTLADQLQKNGSLDEVGGAPFLYEVAGSVATAANVIYHAQIVREKSMLRKLIESCTAIVEKAYQPVEDVDTLLDSAEERIFKIQDFRLKEGLLPMQTVISDIISDLEARSKEDTDMTGVPSGFRDLDELTFGFQKSELIIVAGRPSMGKTSFCLNVALAIASATQDHQEQVPVAIFSLEMSRTQLVQRMLCSYAHVNLSKMRNAKLSDLEWHKLNQAANRLFEAPIYIDDSPAISILELRAKARRLRKKKNIGMVIIDYLQLLTTRGREESRQQEVSLISRSLKALAKELDIPIMALSQLSRAVEGRTEQRPRLADLRESGAIEQDADLVLFIYRPEQAGISEQDGRSTEGLAQVILEKNRNGPTGLSNLLFVKEFTRFENLSFREEMEEE